jgi:CRISPR system Cascade subunit CasD
MSNDVAFLALLLDGPLQSWGYESRFQRRTCGLLPTKSGVIGVISAAMGLAKGSSEERETLPALAKLKMTTIFIPQAEVRGEGDLPVLRVEDFHTVLETRRASGGLDPNPVVTRRQYLVDARFGVILTGDRAILDRAAAALQNPKWGIWLGRKNCIPASPVFIELCSSQDAAWRALLRVCKLTDELPIDSFTTMADVDRFDEGTDSFNDQPVSFGDASSSGPENRRFAVRRIRLVLAGSRDRKSEV